MLTSTRKLQFKTVERQHQTRHFQARFAGKIGFGGDDVRLQPDHAAENLWAPIQESALASFAVEPVIQWHQHANHGLSSQVCCVNFLMPMADRPDVLARWIGHVLDIDPPEMLPVEQRAGQNCYVAFEWIGDVDHLNEGNAKGVRKRGANATASDAAVKFRATDSRIHLLLIEWKYTEEYRNHRLSEDKRGTRTRRYRDIAFEPRGPIRSDLGLRLGDFFHEPFYQLLRQQMLAWHIERDEKSGVDRARVLHLSPAGNRALHQVTAPALERLGDDAFEVFKSVLVDPFAFVSRSTEEAFAPLPEWAGVSWYEWLRDRYPGLCGSGRAA